jgi:hypothetical protein
MTIRTDEIDFGWLFEDFLEVSLKHLPDGMWEMHYRTTAERGAVITEALERVAAAMPRAPETTDEQHDYDAMIELSRWYHAHKAGQPNTGSGADLASQAMATIRNADENARTLRGKTPGSSNVPADPKLRATTEIILAMPVDDRLRQLEAESSFFSSIRPLGS